MPPSFLIPLTIYLLGNGYIYYRSFELIMQFPLWGRCLFSAFFILGVFSIIPIFIARNTSTPYGVMHFLYMLGTSWLAITLYMFIMLLLTDALRLFHVYLPHRYLFCLITTFTLLAYGYYRYIHPDVNVLSLNINKPIDGKKRLRVALVSDVHLGFGTTKSRLDYYVNLINRQHPDLILLPGDLIDSTVKPVADQKMDEEINQLQAPMGIYMTSGNHEHFAGTNSCRKFISEHTPIIWMEDTTVILSNGIQLIGRDDLTNPRRKQLSVLIGSIDRDKPVFLLDHQPKNLEEAVENGIDLQVSGHTHHGQIWPMNLLTDQLFEVSHGYKQKEGTHVYVSSGLSLWGPPFRIGTRSELVILDLQFK